MYRKVDNPGQLLCSVVCLENVEAAAFSSLLGIHIHKEATLQVCREGISFLLNVFLQFSGGSTRQKRFCYEQR